MRYLRPVELFRNGQTRKWAIAALALLAVAAGVVAVFKPSIGLAITLVLVVYLLSALVDFSADAEITADERRAALIKDVRKAVAKDDDARVRAVAERVTKLATRAPGIVATYAEPRDVPYGTLLQDAAAHDASFRRVQIVGWYFTYLLDGARGTAVADFLGKDGKVDVVVPDVSAPGVADWIADLRGCGQDPMTSAQLTDLVCGSVRRLESLRVKAGAPDDAVRVFARQSPIVYAAYCFADRHLIFGSYEHAFDPSARPPRLHIDLAYSDAFAAFWRAELQGMTSRGGQVDIDQWLQALGGAVPP